ncbi:MAG: mechanosensitive ion channel family protein, partial [Ilumatobacter sp.]
MDVISASAPCWEASGTPCRVAYDLTDGNEAVANLTDWFLQKPLQILVVVVLAWILVRLARRWVRSFVKRAVAPHHSSADRLGRIGIQLPGALAPVERDPRRAGRANSISLVLTGTTIVAIWVIALLTVFGIVGIELGPLIAGAGVAGVALGFGAQSLVKDCI